jgi:opacity protein-like surface antigen
MKTFLPLLLLGFSGALWAQSGELWFSGGASILANRNIGSPFSDGQPDDVRLGDGFRAGIRFALNSSGHLGHEFQYAYNRTRVTDVTGVVLGDPGSAGMAIHQGGYNLLYYFRPTNEEQTVRPFVTGGVHISDSVLPGSAALTRTSIKPGFNVGVGVKVRISTLFALRFDVRQYETGKPNWGGVLVSQGGLLHQTEASAGVGIYF